MTDSREISRNKFRNFLRTAALFLGLLALLLAVGYSLLGLTGLIWAAGIGLILLFSSLRIPSHLIMRMQGGRALSPRQAPQLTVMMQEMTRRAGLGKTPRLYYIPSNALNAFATGHREDPAIGITHGLLQRLTTRELGGVLAHEVGHIINNDLPLRSMVNIMNRMTRFLSFAGKLMVLIYLPLLLFGEVQVPLVALLLLLFAPTLSTLMVLAFSRTREFEADLEAARITGDPGALADALQKLNFYNQGGLADMLSPVQRWTVPKFLRTHPTTGDRVTRLRKLIPRYEPHRQSLPDENSLQNTPFTDRPVGWWRS